MSSLLIKAIRKTARRTKRTVRMMDGLNGPITFRRYGIDLRGVQQKILDLCESTLGSPTGGMYTIKSARQTGKNEMDALMQHRFFERYAFASGSMKTIVRVAPTWSPQIVHSKLRLEKFLNRKVLPSWRKREGFIYECGNARIYFLSGRATTSVEGATANTLLDIDEAHKIDPHTFEEKLVPFTASTNAPTLLWGVGGYSMDILHKYCSLNEANGESWRNLILPAELWAEDNEAFRLHYEDRLRTLGDDHPVIRTQYKLEDLDSTGRFFKEKQIKNVLSGQHDRNGFTDKLSFVLTVDIAGEQEEEVLDPFEKSTGARDATVVFSCFVDLSDFKNGWPMVYVNDVLWWTGKSYSETGGVEGQQELILRRCFEDNAMEVVIDARGLGNQVAKYVDREYGCIEYNATSESCNDDVFNTLSMLNNDRIKMWRNDYSPEWEEFRKQLQHCDYKVSSNGNMNLRKPRGTSIHIDFMKALSYIPRAIEGLSNVEIPKAGIDPT